MPFALAATAFLSLTLVIPSARAAVAVGDKPKLDFTASDGTRVSLEALKGKLVIIDFWAAWCGPCMAEAEHMVGLHKQYKDQGVLMIGISLDRTKDELTRTARQKGFDWPHYFDGKMWESPLVREWGVNGIPRTFILGPEGQVLWTGHPARIDAPLAAALKEHPPQLVDPKVAAEAGQLLEQAQAALRNNDMAAALKVFAKIQGEAAKDKTLAPKIAEVAKLVEAASAAMMGEVEQMIAQKDYPRASARLRELAQITGTPVAKQAQDRLRQLMASPETRAAFEAAAKAQRDADKSKRSEDALAAAAKLQADKRDEQAYAAFKSIVATYGGTPAADQAAAEVAKYDEDPAFAKRAADKAVESKARSALSMAANYRTAGKLDLARQRYEQVIKEFPSSSYAAEAKRELDKLGK